MSERGTLISLPTELHLEIFSYLDYPSSMFLASTNRYFSCIIETELLNPTTEEKLCYIRIAEKLPQNSDLFACFSCITLKSREYFADNQKRKHYSNCGAKGNKRFCLSCGIQEGVWQGKQPVTICGATYHLCPSCKSFQNPTCTCTRCGRCATCQATGYCTECRNRTTASFESLEEVTEATAHTLSHNLSPAELDEKGTLGKLPIAIRTNVYNYLDYPSAIFLSSTNKYYRRVINPQSLIPEAEKQRFVEEAQSFTQSFIHRFACFYCFAVKHRSEFADRQVTKGCHQGGARELTRICIPCGMKYERWSPKCTIFIGGERNWQCNLCMKLTTSICNGLQGCWRCADCQKGNVDRGQAIGPYQYRYPVNWDPNCNACKARSDGGNT